MIIVNAICTIGSVNMSVAAINPAIGTYTTCDFNHYTQVTYETSFNNCYMGPYDSFQMDITEVAEVGDGSLTWAGSFQTTMTYSGNVSDISGTFRVNSVP